MVSRIFRIGDLFIRGPIVQKERQSNPHHAHVAAMQYKSVRGGRISPEFATSSCIRQHCSSDYQKRLCKHGFKVSMSGKGNCYYNSIFETFFKSVKAELNRRICWETRRQAEGAIFQSINGFYNPRRLHSSLGSKSPLAFKRKAA